MEDYLIKFVKCSTLIFILAFQSNQLFAAPDLVNIKACVEKAKQYSGIDLNSAPLNYDNNWIAKDIATWANAECKVSSETVNDLVINNEIVIIDEYAGVAAFNLNEYISDVVKRSNTTLENRLNKGDEVNKLNIRYKTLKDKRYNLSGEKWDADKQISDVEERTKISGVLNRNDEKIILKKNEADTTDYFSSFHKESSVDDALQSLESEIENL